MKNTNEEAFLELINTYKSITREMIKEDVDAMFESMKPFYDTSDPTYVGYDYLSCKTGFGRYDSCTLCQATVDPEERDHDARHNCSRCLYIIVTDKQCDRGINAATYQKMRNTCCFSPTAQEQLYKAVRDRIEHMEKVYKQYLEQLNESSE